MDFEPIPASEVVAAIIESAVDPANSGNGQILKLTWQVTEGQYQNRQFWQNINYLHSSAQAQLIGQQQLKAICEAVGHDGHLDDSEVLHHVPCRVGLKIKTDPGYSPKNEVRFVKPVNAQAPAGKPAHMPAAETVAVPAQSAQAAPPRGKAPAKPAGNRPWQTKAGDEAPF